MYIYKPALAHGTVVDSETGAPISNALVYFNVRDEISARTGSDGTFSVGGRALAVMPILPDFDRYWIGSLFVEAEGYRRFEQQNVYKKYEFTGPIMLEPVQ